MFDKLSIGTQIESLIINICCILHKSKKDFLGPVTKNDLLDNTFGNKTNNVITYSLKRIYNKGALLGIELNSPAP